MYSKNFSLCIATEKCRAAFTERNTFPSTLHLGITLVHVVCITIKIAIYLYIQFFIYANTSHAINLTFAELEYSAMKSLSRIFSIVALCISYE